jgi:uncharacterized membrane protein HdeD (DUF308 family)
MSSQNEAALTTAQDTIFGALKKNWGWLLALGITSIVLGTLGFYMTFAFTVTSVLVFGVLLLVGGLFQLVQAFTCRGWKAVLWHVLIGLLYVAAGIDIIYNPVRASAVLTLVLAGILIAVGVSRIIMAFQIRAAVDGWYWSLLSGVISIVLGGMIIAQWPESGLWVIGLFVAIELLFNGWSTIFVALAARKAAQQETVRA